MLVVTNKGKDTQNILECSFVFLHGPPTLPQNKSQIKLAITLGEACALVYT